MEDAASILNVDAIFTGSTGADIDEQNRMIRQFADEGVDGIAVNIINPVAYNDAIAYAMKKGVPVVAFNVDATKWKWAAPRIYTTIFQGSRQVIG